MAERVRKAVFPVGGMGTRFLPVTKSMPKEMLPVVDKPLIQYAVEEAREAGIEEFVFVTGRGKYAIEDYFDHSFELQDQLAATDKRAALEAIRNLLPEAGRIAYTRQQLPLGLGHAVWCARKFVGREPFAVLLADDLVLAETGCLAQMMDVHAGLGGNVVAVMDVPRDETRNYGVLEVGGVAHGKVVEVRGLVEKPEPEAAPSTLSIIGRYILVPEVFDELDAGERGAGGEIQLTDAMAKLIGRLPFHGYRFDGTRFDCGNKVGFLEANIAFALERPDMRNAVREVLRRFSQSGGDGP